MNLSQHKREHSRFSHPRGQLYPGTFHGKRIEKFPFSKMTGFASKLNVLGDEKGSEGQVFLV